MDTPGHVPTEALLAHASGLRALARGLLGDEHAVDDVLQETWLVALERAPEVRAGLGGWLRAVTRGLALKRRRGEGRRQRRERDVARAESQSVTDALAEREVLEAVVGAVTALGEPYRGVVVDRYWRALPPRSIASERGVPVATVSSQLLRAHRLLRERLDERADSRERWTRALVACLARQPHEPGTPPAETPAPTNGGRSMLWTKTVVGLGTLVLALGWVTTRRVRGPEPAPALRASGTAPLQAGPAAPVETADPRADERRALASPAEPGARPAGVVLEGDVLDQRDQPVASARVLVAAPGAPWNDVARTDARGRFRVVLAGVPEQARLLVRVEQGGYWHAADREISVPADRACALAFSLESAVLTLEADHERLEQAEGGADAEAARIARERFEAASARIQRQEPSAPEIEAEPASGDALRLCWPPYEPVEIFDETLAEISGVSRPMGPEPGFEGTLRDGEGRPVAGAWVLAYTEPWVRRARTDADGGYRISAPPGTQVRAGGGRHGIALATVPAEAAGPLRWDPVLERGLELRGRLVDEEGRGLGGWRVEVEGDDPPYRDATETGADGAFALPNQPDRSLRLSVVQRAKNPFVVVAAEGLRPGVGEHRVTLDAAARPSGALAVAVVGPDGSAIEDAEVRAWQLASGRGARLARTGEGYALDGLPAGRYRVEVSSQSHGALDLGVVEVDAERVDLDPAVLPADGRLDWGPGLVDGTPWSLERSLAGFRLPVASGELPDVPPDLPAGTYALRVGDSEPIEALVPAGGRQSVALPR